MTVLQIIRLADQGLQTTGRFRVMDAGCERLNLAVLELPWRGNARGISCIPKGRYWVTHRAPTIAIPYPHLYVHDVPGRSGICIHAGNFLCHTKGCPLVGLAHTDINADGLVDVASSRIAIDKLVALVPDDGCWLDVSYAIRFASPKPAPLAPLGSLSER